MSDYIVGSFNIQKLNLTKDFEKLAEIITKSNYDVVAIQEANSIDAVKQIVGHLGKNWDYACQDRNCEYAYIWRKRRLKLLETTKGNNPVTVEGGIHFKGNEVKLVRPPFVAYFTSQGLYGGCNFELRLINAHLAFSRPTNAPNGVGEIDARRNELSLIAREIYSRADKKVFDEVRSVLTLVLGDYNLCLSETYPRITDGIHKYETLDGIPLKTIQELPTSLKKPKDENTENNDDEDRDAEFAEEYCIDFYSKDYDHFSYDETKTEKYRLKSTRVDALRDYYDNDLSEYRKNISDHVPIKLEITLM